MSRSHTRWRSCGAPCLLLLLFGLMRNSACAQVQPEAQPPAASQSSTDTSLPVDAPISGMIGPGDLVLVQVVDMPELNRRFRVDEDGNISLAYLGLVHVAGETSTDFENYLAHWLVENKYVVTPAVSVQIVESVNRSLTILGEVTRPGIYPAFGNRTIADAIALAQGLTHLAGSEVAVIPSGKTEKDEKLYPVRGPMGDQAPAMVRVHPGDTLIVHRASLVYVLGAVTKPGGYPYEGNQLTVLNALALAGGPLANAKLDKSIALHQGEYGARMQTLPLKQMLEAKAIDPLVIQGDIIYVPTAQAKTILLETIPSVLGAAAGASIYGLNK